MHASQVTVCEATLLLDTQTIAEAAFTVDLDQRIISWNEHAERLLGYSADEVVGQYCPTVMKQCHAHCPAIANARRGRASPPVDVSVEDSGGEQRSAQLSTLLAQTPSGQTRIVHLFHSMTTAAHPANDTRVTHTPTTPLSAHVTTPPATQSSASTPTPIPPLTRREIEVLRLLAAGHTTPEIAAELSIRPMTARNHVTSVINKLGVSTRLQAVVAASRLHLI